MKKLFLIVVFFLSITFANGQNDPQLPVKSDINRDNLIIRPNSRDYMIVRKGNNHQRLFQIRTQAMVKYRQAMLNREMAMEHRRIDLQQHMIRQQQIRQRMIRQRIMSR
jgi:hypothetical protein